VSSESRSVSKIGEGITEFIGMPSPMLLIVA
jgi:hypothetical protein